MIELLAALAVARVSVFIVRERAPFAVMEKIRAWVGAYPVIIPDYNTGELPKQSELGYLLGCVWCISIWVGLIACLLLHFPLWYALPFSAVAIAYDEKIS